MMTLLINPPNPDRLCSNKDMMGGLGQVYPAGPGTPSVPPLDLYACAAVLKTSGTPFALVDCLPENIPADRALAQAVATTPSLALVRTSLPTLSADLAFSEALKAGSGARIGFFGPVTKLVCDDLIAGGADAVLIGEPEAILPQLVANNLAFPGVPGIVWKEGGGVRRNSDIEPIQDLDALPFPLWEARPADFKIEPFFGKEPYFPVLASRGCPFGCRYCPYTRLQGRVWRPRSAANVLAEVKHNSVELGVHNVLFRDPEFTLNEERTLEICEGLRALGGVRWACETRPDTVNPGMIRAMAAAGCSQINFGVESLSARALEESGRKAVDRKRLAMLAAEAQRVGVRLFCFFIIGLPGQKRRDILNDVEFAFANLPGLVQFTCATPYPGTLMRDWAESRQYIEERDFAKYSGYAPVMRNETLSTADLAELMDFAWEKLRARGGPGRSLRSAAGCLYRRVALKIREARLEAKG
jgi:radical SAM superfamily enzyme YgiQ (UPF0313 family)